MAWRGLVKKDGIALQQAKRQWWRVTLISCLMATLSNGVAQAAVERGGALSGDVSNADALLAVDCLLPPQLRKLGKQRIYSAPRRPIKTTATDCEIRGGEYASYDRANYRTALQVWLPLAQDGDAQAQTYVGEIHEKGLGLEADPAAAAVWYQRAAEQDYPRAQLNLGALYEQGLGVPFDRVAALNWYRRASGLAGDELVYAATMTAANTAQQELEQLRRSFASSQAELRVLRKKLTATEQDSVQQQVELQRTRRQLTIVNERLTSARQAVRLRGDAEQNQLQRLEAEMIRLERELREQERRYEMLEAQLNAQQTEVRDQLQDRVAREAVLRNQLAVAAPEIELQQPPLTVIRGVTAARARNQSQQLLSGRVNAPAGLLQLTVNGQALQAGPDGHFEKQLSVGDSDLPVTIVAVDAAGRDARMDFTLVTNLPLPRETSKPVAMPAPTGQYHALLIGNADYPNYPNLETPLNDVRQTAAVLAERYGFKTTLVENASRYRILSALNELNQRVGPDDHVLIYFAGHGELDHINNRGYWLPVDAEPDNRANWLSNQAITDLLNIMPANHVMVVADSCYSGELTRAAIPRIPDASMPPQRVKWLDTVLRMRARTVLTSGGSKPVVDGPRAGSGDSTSVFASAFIDVLRDNNQVLSGQDVFLQLARRVAQAAARLNVEQRPRYAPIRHAGHEAGEFLFYPSS